MTVVNNVALGRIEKLLSLPKVIRHVVSPNTEFKAIFGNPKVRKDDISVIFIGRREYKYKRCNIGCGRKVKTTVANAPFEVVFGDGKRAFVPFLHRHPTHRLLHPLVKAELPESVFFGGVLLCGLASCTNLVDANGNTKGGICLFPYLGVCPIIVLVRTVNDGIEGWVNLSTLDDVFRLLVRFIADGTGVGPGGGYQKVEGLHTSIARTLRHNIKELSVRLRVKLVKDNAVYVEAVLGISLGRENLVKAVRGDIYDTLGSG